jgi:Fe-S oxidoreductase
MPQIENVIDTVENCRYCLMCRHVAPVEIVTFRESLSPHGLGLLVASVRRGLLDYTPEVVEKIFSEAYVGLSRAHCVTDQPHDEAFAAVRADLVAANLAPAAVVEAGEKLAKYGNPYKEESPAPPDGSGPDALFVGDDGAYLSPESVEAALTLLKAAGVTPIKLGSGRNNGLLAQSLGFPQTAADLAQATLDDLKKAGVKRLFVLGPGDAYTFTQAWEERLGIEWPADVEVVEVTTFLADQLAAGKITFKAGNDSLAYIDPTHAIRVPGRHAAPRALLAAALGEAPGELFWREWRAHPAGNTSIQWGNLAISGALTRARLQDAVDFAGAQAVVTEDPGTLSALKCFAADFDVTVTGLYELLADRLA